MKKLLLLFLGVCVFASCKQEQVNDRLVGYDTLGHGVYITFIETAKSEVRPEKGDVVSFYLTVMKEDSVISATETPLKLVIDQSAESLPIQKALQLMTEGDSARVIVETDSLLIIPTGFKKGERITMDLRLLSILSKEDIRTQKEEILETFQPTNDGFAIKKAEEVAILKAKKPVLGDKVIINMTMRNGNVVIAKSGDVGTPREFIIPTNKEMLTPLHKAIQTMSVGDSVTIAIDVDDFPRPPRGFSTGEVMQVDIRLIAVNN